MYTLLAQSLVVIWLFHFHIIGLLLDLMYTLLAQSLVLIWLFHFHIRLVTRFNVYSPGTVFGVDMVVSFPHMACY